MRGQEEGFERGKNGGQKRGTGGGVFDNGAM